MWSRVRSVEEQGLSDGLRKQEKVGFDSDEKPGQLERTEKAPSEEFSDIGEKRQFLTLSKYFIQVYESPSFHVLNVEMLTHFL